MSEVDYRKLAELFERICFDAKKQAKRKKGNPPDFALMFGTAIGIVELSKRGSKNRALLVKLLGEISSINTRGLSPELIGKEVNSRVGWNVGLSPSAIKSSSNTVIADTVNVLSNYTVTPQTISLPVWGLKLLPHHFVLNVGSVDFYLVTSAPNRWYQGLDLQSRTLIRVDDSPTGGSPYWASTTLVGSPTDQPYLISNAERNISQALSALVLFINAIPATDVRRTSYLSFLPRPATIPLEATTHGHRVVSDGNRHDASEHIRLQTMTLEVRQADLTAFNQTGFRDVCQTLVGQNDLQLRIRKALEIFSTGLRIFELDQMFVTHTTCFETILMHPNERPIRRKLAERVSSIIGSNHIERTSIAATVDTLYRIRSGIVHQGQEIEHLEQYHQALLEILFKLVVRLSDGRFQTLDALIAFSSHDTKPHGIRLILSKAGSKLRELIRQNET